MKATEHHIRNPGVIVTQSERSNIKPNEGDLTCGTLASLPCLDDEREGNTEQNELGTKQSQTLESVSFSDAKNKKASIVSCCSGQ